MYRYVIEREIPAIGLMSPGELCVATATSNAALAGLAGRVQWEQSFVADERTFCLYLARDDATIREQVSISGSRVRGISRIRTVIDPTTGQL